MGSNLTFRFFFLSLLALLQMTLTARGAWILWLQYCVTVGNKNALPLFMTLSYKVSVVRRFQKMKTQGTEHLVEFIPPRSTCTIKIKC